MKIKIPEDSLTWSFLIYLLIVFAIFTRLIPHPDNFTSIAAVGLFSGAYLSNRISLLAPMLALFVSDVVIGFYNPIVMLFVYIGFSCSVLIGRGLLQHNVNIIRLGGCAILSASIFFILSNFGMWVAGFYPYTFDGLLTCYTLAIPFFKNMLAGDLFYVFILFGVYELFRRVLKQESIVE